MKTYTNKTHSTLEENINGYIKFPKIKDHSKTVEAKPEQKNTDNKKHS